MSKLSVLFAGIFCIFAHCAPLKASLQANFTQIISSDKGQITYQGRVSVSEDEQIFQYDEPEHKRICVKGKNSMVIDDDLEQVSFYVSKASLKEILKQAKQISEDNYDAKIDKITYHIHLKNNQINTLTYVDELGNHAQINFTPASVQLDCTVPKDYDVIKDQN